MILRLAILLTLCARLLAQPFVLVGAGMNANTNVRYWQPLNTPFATNLVTLNVTSPPPQSSNYYNPVSRIQYTGPGWIQASTDLVHWITQPVNWFPYFLWTNAGSWYFRAPAVPPLYPTNGPAILPP